MTTAVVVGNLKPRSRTFAAAVTIAHELTGAEPDVVIDVITLGADLLGWGNEPVAAAVTSVREADYLVCASPTFKGTYSGVLKLFLDQIPENGLDGVTAFPLMLGAGPHHALAPELLLKPVLVELGAACPSKGLYVLETEGAASEVAQAWLPTAQRWIR
jgi:FMN reductase